MSLVRRLLAASALLCLIAASVIQPIAAQNSGVSGLSISPTRADFTIKAGQADKLDISLKNVTGGDINAKPIVNDFTSDNETGEPKIITDTTKEIATSIRSFLYGLEDVQLKKGEQKKVTLSIQIPGDAAPGAYFGLIRYDAIQAGAAAPQPGQVALSASVGTIVLITVPGKVISNLQLVGVKTYNGDIAGWFYTVPPKQVGIEVKNLGNGFSQPFGRVSVSGFRHHEVYSYELNGNSPRANVLPASSRIFKDSIKNITKPGRYTVTASVSYVNGGEVLVGKATFWYIPTWLTILIVLGIGFLVLLTWLAWRRYKRINRHHRR